MDEATLTCVNSNPVRAGLEENLMTDHFTSIQQRLYEYIQDNLVKNSPTISDDEKQLTKRIQKQEALKHYYGLDKQPEAPLMAFPGSAHTDIHICDSFYPKRLFSTSGYHRTRHPRRQQAGDFTESGFNCTASRYRPK